MTAYKLNRREFLKRTGQVGGGLMLASTPTFASATDFQPNVFIRVRSDNRIDVVCHRSEMGQGIRTSLQQIFADELEARWDSINLMQAEGDARYGDQNTDGSRSIRVLLPELRAAGAAARQMLEKAASIQWQVPESECKAELNTVVHAPSGKSLAYGELTDIASDLDVPASPRLKDSKDFRYIGKAMDSVDGYAMTTGSADYGIDTSMPGMLHASIERSPVLHGTIETYDEDAALAVPGVVAVVRMPETTRPVVFNPLGGIAVLATNTWAAIQGRKALNARWADGSNADYESGAYRDTLMELVSGDGLAVLNRGDVEQDFTEAETMVEASYYAPHLAQAPMEPPAATAIMRDDGVCEVWACTQRPQSARSTVAQVLGVDESKVRINVTFLGGGFGRKSKADFVAEAAWLARRVGKPVKVTWTREDDLKNGYVHSVSAQYLKAGLDADGRTTSWLHRSAFPPIATTFQNEVDSSQVLETGLGLVDNPFEMDNMRIEVSAAPAHVRIGWLRSVANVFHAFAASSFADELAHAASQDPRDYLIKLLGEPRQYDPASDGASYGNYGQSIETYPIDTGRMAHVVRAVSDMANWGRDLPKGHGLGIAVHRSFLSYVGVVAEVSVDKEEKLTVENLWMAIDAGQVINTDRVASQLEGAGIFGMSIALFSELSARDGVIQQDNFDGYELARIQHTPKAIHTHIVQSDHPPGGVGEPGVPPVAPAITNAYFAATGTRVRELPLKNVVAV